MPLMANTTFFWAKVIGLNMVYMFAALFVSTITETALSQAAAFFGLTLIAYHTVKR